MPVQRRKSPFSPADWGILQEARWNEFTHPMRARDLSLLIGEYTSLVESFKPSQVARRLFRTKFPLNIHLKMKSRWYVPPVIMKKQTIRTRKTAELENLFAQCGFRSMWAGDSMGSGPHFEVATDRPHMADSAAYMEWNRR
jgi:hypothetical protein